MTHNTKPVKFNKPVRNFTEIEELKLSRKGKHNKHDRSERLLKSNGWEL